MVNFCEKIEQKEKMPKLEVVASSREEEMERIIWTLRDIEWFKEKGYFPDRLVLPEYYRKIAERILAGEIKLEDVEDSQEFRQALEYSPEDYAEDSGRMKNALEQMKEKTDQIINLFSQWEKQWRFKLFDNYTILLSRYGTEGSYETEIGKMMIRIDSKKPYHTIIHEMVHIGIEESIIQKYKLKPKEQLVNLICAKILELPSYQMPKESGLDKYITKGTMVDLPQVIEAYLAENK